MLFDLKEPERHLERGLVSAVSQILHSRNLVPNENFMRKSIKNYSFSCSILSPKTKTGSRILEKLKGAALGIRETYLKELILVVSEDEGCEDDAVEVYTFTFQYDNGVPSAQLLTGIREELAKLKFEGEDQARDQLLVMLRRIRRLKDVLQPLPKGAYPTFRATYYDHKPSGWQCPGFYAMPKILPPYNLAPDAKTINVFSVHTSPYYKCVLSITSVYLEDEIVAQDKLDCSDNSIDISRMHIDSIEEGRTDIPGIWVGAKRSSRTGSHAKDIKKGRNTRSRRNNAGKEGRSLTPTPESTDTVQIAPKVPTPGKTFENESPAK